MTSGELCRSRGWGPGAVVEGKEFGDKVTVRLTYVGPDVVAGHWCKGSKGAFLFPEASRREHTWEVDETWTLVSPDEPAPGTVRVRVAACVDHAGDWYALGYKTERLDWLFRQCGDSMKVGNDAARFTLTADLPVPRSVEVRADVEVQP